MTSPGQNPSTARDWAAAVARDLPQVDPNAILLTNMPNTKSASSLTFPQFLCLKVLWDNKSRGGFDLSEYVDDDAIIMAKQELGNPNVKAFLNNIGLKKYPADSIFSLVHLYMDLVFALDLSSDWETKVLLAPRPPRVETDRPYTPESPLAGRGSSSRPTMMDIDWESESDTAMEGDFQAETGQSPSSQSSSSTGSGPGDESPASPADYTPAEDEAIVNMAFVLLLNSLTEPYEPMREKGYRWLPNHEASQMCKALPTAGRPLRVVKGNKLLEARTDGCFRHTGHNISAALIEVKPCVRQKAWDKIEWQEGAQMAAHIYKLVYTKSNPDFGLLRCDIRGVKRRLLLSQDHAEIYINIAEYDAAYEQYLGLHHTHPPHAPPQPPVVRLPASHGRAVAGTRDGFLTMRSFGPWRVDTPIEMKSVCKALLAFSFYLAN